MENIISKSGVASSLGMYLYLYGYREQLWSSGLSTGLLNTRSCVWISSKKHL